MKKMYFLAGTFLLAAAQTASAQGNELFFSEYNEGAHQSGVTCPGETRASTGNEKVIEVFNPTTATVPLDQYSIRRYSNGSTTATEDEKMVRGAGGANPGANTMTPSSTFVMAHPEVSLNTIRSVASQYASPRASGIPGPNGTVLLEGGPVQFNGDDAMALVRWTGAQAGQGTPVIVDIFGIIGNRPAPPGTGMQGMWVAVDINGIDTRSANQSLKRRADVSGGSATLTWDTNTNPGLDPTMFNISLEWEQYSDAFATMDRCDQDYSDLGQHTYTGPNGSYLTGGLLEAFNNAISLYPNPATNRVTVALGTARVGQLTVVN
jgi:hypothetical protein